MNDVAIRCEGLSKKYRIGQRESYTTLRDTLTSALDKSSRRLRSTFRNSESRYGHRNNTFWALKDVSFEIMHGEVVGVIGRNGAGKSTLLKILSRVTKPTVGYAEVRGRVGSLLEVGSGFHPELTGRENIYLNGAILGMKNAEIDRMFDEIVAFAEIEKFINTPVKRYSSGMYVRLAFAVAAHLQPEILLLDEVLAVGDIEFQKKCIGKMESVTEEGKTVVVVSHSMSTVKALCSKAMLLEGGALMTFGTVDAVVAKYLNANRVDAAEKIFNDEDHFTGIKQIRVKRIKLLNSVTNSFSVYWKQPISISMEVEVLDRIDNVSFGAGVKTLDGTIVFTVHHDDDKAQTLWTFKSGIYSMAFTLQNQLRPGLYKLHVGADQGHMVMKNIFALDAVTIEVLDHTEKGQTPLVTNEGLINGSSIWLAPVHRT